jgi:hypothetical protein
MRAALIDDMTDDEFRAATEILKREITRRAK